MFNHHSISDLVFEHFSTIFAKRCPHFLFTESNAPEFRWRHDSLTPQASWYYFPTQIAVDQRFAAPRASEFGRVKKLIALFTWTRQQLKMEQKVCGTRIENIRKPCRLEVVIRKISRRTHTLRSFVSELPDSPELWKTNSAVFCARTTV